MWRLFFLSSLFDKAPKQHSEPCNKNSNENFAGGALNELQKRSENGGKTCQENCTEKHNEICFGKWNKRKHAPSPAACTRPDAPPKTNIQQIIQRILQCAFKFPLEEITNASVNACFGKQFHLLEASELNIEKLPKRRFVHKNENRII